MKLTRLSMVVVTLAVSILAAAPQAFGAKGHQGALLAAKGRTSLMACTTYSISCSNGKKDTCCADVSACLAYCAGVCGETCINNTGENP